MKQCRVTEYRGYWNNVELQCRVAENRGYWNIMEGLSWIKVSCKAHRKLYYVVSIWYVELYRIFDEVGAEKQLYVIILLPSK